MDPERWERSYEIKQIQKKTDDPSLERGDIVLLMEADRLYELYISHMSKFNYGSRKVKADTFFEQMIGLGIKKYRKRKINGNSRTICYIEAVRVRSNVAEKFPGMEIPNFTIESDEGLTHLQMLLSGIVPNN